jgi:AraC-like DNA-binding protein
MKPRVHHVIQQPVRRFGVEAMALATDHHFPRHTHDDFGLGLLMFGGHRSWSGRGHVEAAPKDLICVNPGEMHDGAPLGGQPRAWRMVYIPPAILTAAIGDGAIGSFEFVRPSFFDPAVTRLFSRLFAAVVAHRADGLLVEERLVALASKVAATWGAPRLRGRGTPPAVSKALQRIHDNPAPKLSLGELALLSGVSRFQLLRGFARDVGATPHAYLMQRRAQLARELLLSGQPPALVAAFAGLSDQSHLTRVFFRQYCVTPAQFQSGLRAA